MEKVPSLNVQAFIAAYEKFIVTQEDLLAVASHIFDRSNEKSIEELSGMLKTVKRQHLCIEIQEELLQRIPKDETLRNIILDSVFDSSNAYYGIALSVEYDDYYINIWGEGEVYISKFGTDTVRMKGRNAEEEYRCDCARFLDNEDRDIENPFSEDISRYIIFLRQYILEKNKMVFSEGDEINYDALENL